MLVKNIQLNGPVTVRVGDTVFRLMKIGERSLKVGIAAPSHIAIEVEDGDNPTSIKEAVEKAVPPVVKGPHD